MSRGFSPLERRCLLALVSLIRDRESDPDKWEYTEVPLRVLYERLYLPGERSYELERRNQRQAQRRALGRLFKQGYIYAYALAWVNLADEQILRWQGGGTPRRHSDGFRMETPRWRMVGLTDIGIKAALLLEGEHPYAGGAA